MLKKKNGLDSVGPMLAAKPLLLSRFLLSRLGTQILIADRERIPVDVPLLVISNHRSFMDAPLLMLALNRPIRFACHHYMSRVPGLRELVMQLGCFPLAGLAQRRHSFFTQASRFLVAQEPVGVFPEGASPMLRPTPWGKVGAFERGFAHLALRLPLTHLAILPIAIAPLQERLYPLFPLKCLSVFDPSEPLFHQPGWHPLVVYQRVNVLIGHPQWITVAQQKAYRSKNAKSLVAELTRRSQEQIQRLLAQGCG